MLLIINSFDGVSSPVKFSRNSGNDGRGDDEFVMLSGVRVVVVLDPRRESLLLKYWLRALTIRCSRSNESSPSFAHFDMFRIDCCFGTVDESILEPRVSS
jgi:hypothetical protein